MASIAAALHEAKATVVADAEDLLVEIVHAAVCKIVGESALTREGIAGVVACIVGSFREDDELVVRLHPQDARLLRQGSEAADPLVTPATPVTQVRSLTMAATMREDPSIAIGGCIVDSGRGSLDARLDIQLGALRDTLLAVRRQRSGDGRTI
jgi:flagellar assembly protein FliH